MDSDEVAKVLPLNNIYAKALHESRRLKTPVAFHSMGSHAAKCKPYILKTLLDRGLDVTKVENFEALLIHPRNEDAENCEKVKIPAAAGADFNAKDSIGKAALTLMAKGQSSKRKISLLLNISCDVNKANSSRISALWYLENWKSFKGQKECCELLRGRASEDNVAVLISIRLIHTALKLPKERQPH